MTKRKDKNNRVLKAGESYREKEKRYMYRWTDTAGKRHCIYAATLEDLRGKEKDIQRDLSDGIDASHGNMTLNQLFGLWKENKVGLKQTTFTNYLYMYEHFVRPILGQKRIKDIRKSTIRGLYNRLINNGETRTMAINTLEILHNVLRQVFQIAVDDDYLRKNPVDGVLTEIKKANQYETPKRKALTQTQQEAFVSFINDKKKYQSWCPLFAVFLGTGCRVSELIGLRWSDIDWELNTISIGHNLVYSKHLDGKCYFSVTTPKTRAGCRLIPMMPEVRQALLDEKERQKECGIKCKTVVDGYTDFIFLNRFGEPHQPHAINRAIKRISTDYNQYEMDKAETENREPVLIPPFSCHNLRHTFCTRLCENESNIKVIQDVMGHADVQTTMNIYAEAQKEVKATAMMNLSSKIKVY